MLACHPHEAAEAEAPQTSGAARATFQFNQTNCVSFQIHLNLILWKTDSPTSQWPKLQHMLYHRTREGELKIKLTYSPDELSLWKIPVTTLQLIDRSKSQQFTFTLHHKRQMLGSVSGFWATVKGVYGIPVLWGNKLQSNSCSLFE